MLSENERFAPNISSMNPIKIVEFINFETGNHIPLMILLNHILKFGKHYEPVIK